MAKYASYYAPINQALQNFNAQMNENYRRRTAAEYATAQSNLALAKFNAEMDDPRRILAMEQAADQLRPTQIDIKRYMPTNNSSRYELEQWNNFKGNIGSIIGDPGARIEPNGTIMGSDGRPVIVPKHKANQINTRISAAQTLAFDEETMRRGEISAIDGQIRSLQEEQKKTNNPQLTLQIKGMETKRDKLQADLDNPNRRLISLRGKMNRLNKDIAAAYVSGNPDKGWISVLENMGAKTQEEYNALLKAMGKSGTAEGIQLKRYVNPATGKVIDLPVSKFTGAEYEKVNPIAGGVVHPGTWVLQDTSTSPGGPMEAAREVNYFIDNYTRQNRSVTLLKNILAEGEISEAMMKTLSGLQDGNQLDPMLAIALSGGYDEDQIKASIGDLESAMKFKRDNVRKLYRDPTVHRELERFFGTEKQPGFKNDPFNLSDTSVGNKYKGTGIPSELIAP